MLARLDRYGPVNSHDVLKLLALVAMTVDHLGAYIFVEDLWWRSIGRSFIPVWFFLVGYAPHTRNHPSLWIGALIVAAVTAMTYTAFFPLNVLFTIIICRYVLTVATRHDWITRYPAEVMVACLLFYIVTMPLFEYGTLAVAFAAFGRMVRDGAPQKQRLAVMVVLTLAYGFSQIAAFAFSVSQSVVVMAMAMLCTSMLFMFTIKEVNLPSAIAWPTKLLSRYSLEYYVLHRCALKCIAAFVLGTAPAAFTWMAL